MKTVTRIGVAFALNLILAVVGMIGGALTGSIAIVSNSLHSLGDSITIGIASVLEKKSKRKPDKKHTFGYARYSVFGGLLTNIFLIVGAIILIVEAAEKLLDVGEHHHDHESIMILAIAGAIMNFIAMLVTRKRKNSNERAVSLHALQDTLAWCAVVVSTLLDEHLGFESADTYLSIIIAAVILGHAVSDLLSDLYIFLDNTPPNVNYEKLVADLRKVKGLKSLHHLHIWSLDGEKNCASLHVVGKVNIEEVHQVFAKHNIEHATIEIESKNCRKTSCELK